MRHGHGIQLAPRLSDALFAPSDQITLRGRHLSTIELTAGYFEVFRGDRLAATVVRNDTSQAIAAAPDQVECVWPQSGAGRLHAVRFASGAETVTLGTGKIGPLGGLIVVNGYYQHAEGGLDRSSSWIWGAYAAAGSL